MMNTAQRQEILNRYFDHKRRFETVAERRSSAGAEVIELFPDAPRAIEAEPSARELEVLQLVSEGLTNREIGTRLFLSEETVKSHVRNLLTKLDARCRAHAVAAGFRLALIS